MAAIEVEGLTKVYGENRVVDGIDLQVDEGEILAFLGPNGAGKTTSIEILEGFREPTSGRVSVLGQNPSTAPLSWRERIGIVLQESEPVAELTARESVIMQSGYYSKPRDPDDVLEIVGLSDSASQRTRKLSGGQRRRLDLALALVGDPELVFLDEPTTGFDPTARRESWTMIEALREMGRTVMLTTHYMDEAQVLADRIVVIAGGQIVATGTADQLADQIKAKPRISYQPRPGEAAPASAFGFAHDGIRLTVETDDVTKLLYELTGWARESGVSLDELDVVRPNLEDTYLQLIKDTTAEGVS